MLPPARLPRDRGCRLPQPRCRQLPAQPPITVSRVPGVTGAWGRRAASSGLPRATGSSAPRPPPRPPSCPRSAGSCLIPVVAEQLSQVCGHRQVCPALRPRVCVRACATPPPRTCGPGCGITPGAWALGPQTQAGGPRSSRAELVRRGLGASNILTYFLKASEARTKPTRFCEAHEQGGEVSRCSVRS